MFLEIRENRCRLWYYVYLEPVLRPTEDLEEEWNLSVVSSDNLSQPKTKRRI